MASHDVSDTWQIGAAYEQYVGRWSRRVAPLFLSWLDVPAERRWLDVGCGTGELAAAILDRCSPSSVVGVEPSEGFLERARQRLGDRVQLRRGSAEQLPLDDACADVAVSGLVLNFFPDPRAALAEMARVTTGGGTIAAYVWDYAGKMQMMRAFWDAAVELDADAARFDEGARFPICRADRLAELCTDAGLCAAEVTPIDIATPFASFEDSSRTIGVRSSAARDRPPRMRWRCPNRRGSGCATASASACRCRRTARLHSLLGPGPCGQASRAEARPARARDGRFPPLHGEAGAGSADAERCGVDRNRLSRSWRCFTACSQGWFEP
jgi:SAM-dependent methyltransferase